MITAHHKDAITLHDGTRDHTIKLDAFTWMKTVDAGGIHPAITSEEETWLAIPPETDRGEAPIPPVLVDHKKPVSGRTVTMRYLPIRAYLQARYGPDDQIVTVPINGDAMAQRLHWLKRNDKERREMKAILMWLGAWRLTDKGDVPG